VLQALVLVRHRIPGGFWWAVANPPAWALGWFVTSYVITANIDVENLRTPSAIPQHRSSSSEEGPGHRLQAHSRYALGARAPIAAKMTSPTIE
jgi:hypothetical protein